MEEFIKKDEKKNIVSSGILVVLALLLIMKPMEFIKTVVIVIGALLLVDGVINFVQYFKEERKDMFSVSFFEGVIELIAGIFLIFRYDVLIDIFPVILGIIIIIKNLFKLQLSLNLKNVVDTKWTWGLAISLVSIVLGIIIVLNPFGSLKVVVIASGIIILVSEVINIIYSFMVLKDINGVKKENQPVIEVEFEEKTEEPKEEKKTTKKNSKTKKNK
jgi:uncharacterized membrane protein HdeD (DUF308 family)